MISRRSLLAGAGAMLPATAARADSTRFVVRTRDGREWPARDLLGQVTLVHFWASWCVSCRTEFPALDRLHHDLAPEGLALLAISIDRLGWPVIEQTLQSVGVTGLLVFHDLNRVAAQTLAIEALPTTLVLDRSGREIERFKGSIDWDAPAMREKLSQRLR